MSRRAATAATVAVVAWAVCMVEMVVELSAARWAWAAVAAGGVYWSTVAVVAVIVGYGADR